MISPTDEKKVQELADRLITTLSPTMASEKADAIVADVASELYRDILGIEGQIVAKGGTQARVCGSFGSMRLAEYEFRREGAA